MKRPHLIAIFCGLLALPPSAQAALPSLSELATNFTMLSERYEQLTNTLAETRARLDDSSMRLAESTNRIARLIEAFNSTRELRKALHGDFVSHFITNIAERTIKRVDLYKDGYEYVEEGRAQRYYTPEEMAERIANRKTVTLDDRIAALNVQIANLEAKRTNGTNELEAAHATIQLAAKRKTLERLEASRTNVVDVVTTPQEGN